MIGIKQTENGFKKKRFRKRKSHQSKFARNQMVTNQKGPKSAKYDSRAFLKKRQNASF